MKIEEPDRPSCASNQMQLQLRLDENKHWTKYKEKLIDKTLKQQYLAKN